MKTEYSDNKLYYRLQNGIPGLTAKFFCVQHSQKREFNTPSVMITSLTGSRS